MKVVFDAHTMTTHIAPINPTAILDTTASPYVPTPGPKGIVAIAAFDCGGVPDGA